MAKKSIITSIRMDEEVYLKIKALKEKYNISWNEVIKCANRVLEKDMNKQEKK